MKQDIHPNYVESQIRCACGAEFRVMSTKPEIHVGICAKCHPFFTGKQKLMDTEGRVDRFRRKYKLVDEKAVAAAAAAAAEAAAAAKTA